MHKVEHSRAQRLWRDDSGQSLIEYGLVAALLALLALAGASQVGTTINQLFGIWASWASDWH